MDMEVIDNVITAYEAVKLNDVSKSIIALCTFIALIIVINRFITAYKGGRKINCVMRCSRLNSSVGDRPAPRGGTTRPDERKITTI